MRHRPNLKTLKKIQATLAKRFAKVAGGRLHTTIGTERGGGGGAMGGGRAAGGRGLDRAASAPDSTFGLAAPHKAGGGGAAKPKAKAKA